MIVVSNTTPLIGLASIQRFDLLRELFGEVSIAQAVYNEAVVAGREAGGAKQEVSTATWIKTMPVTDRLAVEVLLDELDLGEAETIVLARELGADWVLMDERTGAVKDALSTGQDLESYCVTSRSSDHALLDDRQRDWKLR